MHLAIGIQVMERKIARSSSKKNLEGKKERATGTEVTLLARDFGFSFSTFSFFFPWKGRKKGKKESRISFFTFIHISTVFLSLSPFYILPSTFFLSLIRRLGRRWFRTFCELAFPPPGQYGPPSGAAQ
jgi:hypothetical protein